MAGVWASTARFLMEGLAALDGALRQRGSHIVASYLVSDLQQDWRYGADWFEEHLLDYEPASNWGNWAYLAGACSDPQRTGAFNALRQARQYDPDTAYVSLWLAELRSLPQHLRHTPFLLSQLQIIPSWSRYRSSGGLICLARLARPTGVSPLQPDCGRCAWPGTAPDRHARRPA
ncbi:MAG: FAD-binding domain-containing protein, partial [Pseudomonas sp.]